MKGIETSHRYE